MYDTSKVVDVATVTKLTRNLFIIAIIPFLSYLFFNNKNKEVKTKTLPKWYTFIPLFVIGFLLFSLIRTIGDITLTNSGQAFGIFNPNTWETIDRKSTRLNSSHVAISYAVFCLKKNKY